MMDESRRPAEDAEANQAPATGSGVTDGNLAHSMELSEFMERLGMVFDLPSRRRKREMAAAATIAAGPSPALRRQWVSPALIVALLVTVAAGYLVLRPEVRADPLPDVTIGKWVTTDARYRQRSFDLSPTTVIFQTGTGDGDATRHPVLGTTVTTDHGKQIVTVDYGVGDGSMALAFWIDDGPEPTLRLMSQQDIVWTRAEEADGRPRNLNQGSPIRR